MVSLYPAETRRESGFTLYFSQGQTLRVFMSPSCMNGRAAERADSDFDRSACITMATLYPNRTHHDSGTQLEFSQGKTLRPGDIWLRLRVREDRSFRLTHVEYGFTQ
jgi:hypothetical protein